MGAWSNSLPRFETTLTPVDCYETPTQRHTKHLTCLFLTDCPLLVARYSTWPEGRDNCDVHSSSKQRQLAPSRAFREWGEREEPNRCTRVSLGSVELEKP